MPRAKDKNGRPFRPQIAHQDEPAPIDAVVCKKRTDGDITISTPIYFDPAYSNEAHWGPEKERTHNFIAANILYGFLQNEATPAAIRSHLLTLTGRIHDPDEPERQSATRAYLLYISQAFSEDFIRTLPVGEGIIPADQVQAWLARSIDVPYAVPKKETFTELDDQYIGDGGVEVSRLPFTNHGFVCARTAKRPTYNIDQKIWLQRKLLMDWRGSAVAFESLAANVIDRFIESQASTTRLRQQVNGSIGDFYTPFADDFLYTMPKDGGQIPLSVMSRWFNRHL